MSFSRKSNDSSDATLLSEQLSIFHQSPCPEYICASTCTLSSTNVNTFGTIIRQQTCIAYNEYRLCHIMEVYTS